MIVEDVQRRVFAALRFVHAVTGAPVTRPLSIHAPGLKLVRNLSGLEVVREARGHEGYTQEFQAPPKLGNSRGDFECTVHDPAGEFLPRAFTLKLPRPAKAVDEPPAVAAADEARAVIHLPLLPAAALAVAPAWALLRLAVHVDGSNPPRGIANVWVEAQPQVPGKPMRLAQTDAHGEALVIVPDVGPISGAVPLASGFNVDLTLVLDPQLVRASPRSDEERRTLPLPDAAVRAARRAASRIETPSAVSMRAGATQRHVVALVFP